MKNRYRLFVLMALLAVFISSCEKEGRLAVSPVQEFRPIKISGFVMKDTLEQYFDGVKMRECYARVSYDGRIAFVDDKPIQMELRKKGSSEVVYTRLIELNDPTDENFTFFYDGTKVTEKFEYPDAVAGVEQIAFYFEFPDDMPVDIVYGDGSDINSVTYLARNVQPKQRTAYFQIPPMNDAMYIFLLKAGKKEYLLRDDINYSFMQNIQLTSQVGGVQSWYVGLQTEAATGEPFMSESDLVQAFGR